MFDSPPVLSRFPVPATAQRSMALLLVIPLWRSGSAALAYRVRPALTNPEATGPDPPGKRLHHPTAPWVFHGCGGDTYCVRPAVGRCSSIRSSRLVTAAFVGGWKTSRGPISPPQCPASPAPQPSASSPSPDWPRTDFGSDHGCPWHGRSAWLPLLAQSPPILTKPLVLPGTTP
jgi:hypothetical protein